jgi:hypothetical protein
MGIRLVEEFDGDFSGLCIIENESWDDPIEGEFFKDEDGEVVIFVEDGEVPTDVLVTITLKDENNSQYQGSFNNEGFFTA